MPRPVAALLVLLLALTPLACGDDDDNGDDAEQEQVESPSESSSTLELTEDDAESSHTVAVGDEIEISLEQCIGCGYTWALMGDADPEVIELVSEKDLEVDQEPGMVGGMTRHVKTFRAKAAGDVVIALGHIPPGDEAPEEVLTFELEIEQ